MRKQTGQIAIVGATLIDGNGGRPMERSAVLVQGSRIIAVGSQDSLSVPPGCERIDAEGKFLVPGFIDTNVHLALFGSAEELVRYHERFAAIALESAQIMLRYGVTTVHDSFGPLKPLLATRDLIAGGEAPGPRVYIAGNIVGWGGPCSLTFALPGSFELDVELWGLASNVLTFFLEQIQDEFTEGSGEELTAMEPEEPRNAMNAYLDKGVDFVKYGGTNHTPSLSMMLFSPDAQKVIVDETHRRGKFVETHSTSPEGQRLSLEAGIDLIQHPELADVPMSDRLAALHAAKGVICSMHTGRYTGNEWIAYQEKREAEEKETSPNRPLTGMEQRRAFMRRKHEWWRSNAQKLLRDGCTMTAASDAVSLRPPELTREDADAWPTYMRPGIGTLEAIEGLFEIGMTPMQALVAATKNGALAAQALEEYGTIEEGKAADLLVLDEDPLVDIRNIRKQFLVMKGGKIVDTAQLPAVPVLSQRYA